MYCLSKCCRLCLIKNNTLVNITCCGSDRISFLDKLGMLAPSLVANPRNYMNWICQQCLKRLEKSYRFIQHCFKSHAIFDEYCIQLASDDTAQNKCTYSDVSVNQLTENMFKECITIPVKDECSEDLPAFDVDQYLESSITIVKHELSPVDFEIKLESSELKKEADFNVGADSTLNDEIMMSECDRGQAENVQIDQIAGTSGENNISFSSDVLNNDAKERADNCNMTSSNSLTKRGSKTFTKSGNLKRHESIHSGECPFKCNICEKKFTLSSHLKEHKRIHTGERPYECKICNKTFTLSGDLKKHERIHTGERPYECKICEKKFTQSGTLKYHERIHSGERPFKCNMCEKKFTLSSHLKGHKRIHTGERPYECKICEKKFTQSSTLKDHERVHSGERPFKCNICEKKFINSNHLKVHERIHTGERPYECKICKKKFIESGSLKRHKAIHSGDSS